jgi:hypothetical protein
MGLAYGELSNPAVIPKGSAFDLSRALYRRNERQKQIPSG